MIRLQIHNDGKEKYSSYEARLKIDDEFLQCYGQETKEEAIQEMREKVQKIIEAFQNIDWSDFDWIAWDGRVLPNGA